jgi:hypothetical protein
MAEGPLTGKNNSSFVVSYRYGIASLAATGTSAIPYYQDLSFKFDFGQTKLGRFELFGLGGLSSIDFLGAEIDENDLFANPQQDLFVENQLGLVGVKHESRLGKTAFLTTTVGMSTNANFVKQDNILFNAEQQRIGEYRATNVDDRENRLTLSSVLNKKFNARFNLRSGLLLEHYMPRFFTNDRDRRTSISDSNNDGVPDTFITLNDVEENYQLLQAYSQGEYKFNNKLSLTAGLQLQHHTFTEATAVNPRAAVSYQLTPRDRFSLAYGRHAQAVASPILFRETEQADGSSARTNASLDFIKSHHYVLAYDRNLAADWRLKVEGYYQDLFDVPVERVASSYSALNEGADFVFEEKSNLVNEGTGRNYGVELTLEKFFNRGYYLLLTTSAYNSLYTGSDGIERSTAFNNQFVLNTLFGKEWKFGRNQNNALTFDTRLTTAGGNPYTPIDLAGTRANGGRELRFNERAFSENYEQYFRVDTKFGIRLNRKKVSHQFFIDLQNVTNRENEFVQRYNVVTDQINRVNQIGFFPDVLYRVQF